MADPNQQPPPGGLDGGQGPVANPPPDPADMPDPQELEELLNDPDVLKFINDDADQQHQGQTPPNNQAPMNVAAPADVPPLLLWAPQGAQPAQPQPMHQNPLIAEGLRALSQDPRFDQLIASRTQRIPNFNGHDMSPFQKLVRVVLLDLSPGQTHLYIILRRIFLGNTTISPESISGLTPENISSATNDIISLHHARIIHSFARRYEAQDFQGAADNVIYDRLLQYNQIGPVRALSLMVFGLEILDFVPQDQEFNGKLVSFLGQDAVLTPEQINEILEGWHPHRGLAAWLIWKLHRPLAA